MCSCPCMAQPDLVRRLIAAGCPLDINESYNPLPLPSGLLICQVGGEFTNRAFDLNPPGTGYMLDLEIASNVRGLLVVRYFTLELPWEAPQFSWLPDPAESGTKKDPYVIPGTGGLEFPRKLVINHRTSAQGRLRRRDILDGLLLGMSFESIPDCFRHGAMVDATLCIVDQLERRYPSKITLWVDRSAKRLPRSPKRPRKPLFEEVDHPIREGPAKVSR